MCSFFLLSYKFGQTLINDDEAFQVHHSKIFNDYTPIGFIMITFVHLVLCTYSVMRYKFTKDPREQGGEDDEVEKIVYKYKMHIKMKIKATNESLNSSILDRTSYDLGLQVDEFRFMREVIYNYLDTQIKRRRRGFDFDNSKHTLFNLFYVKSVF